MRRAKSASAPLLPASVSSHTAHKAHHCTSDKPSAASPQTRSLRIANTQNVLFSACQQCSSDFSPGRGKRRASDRSIVCATATFRRPSCSAPPRRLVPLSVPSATSALKPTSCDSVYHANPRGFSESCCYDVRSHFQLRKHTCHSPPPANSKSFSPPDCSSSSRAVCF